MIFLCQFMGRVKMKKTLRSTKEQVTWEEEMKQEASDTWTCARGCSGKSSTGLGNKSS